MVENDRRIGDDRIDVKSIPPAAEYGATGHIDTHIKWEEQAIISLYITLKSQQFPQFESKFNPVGFLR